MPGIDPSIIVHRLNADPSFRPVRQKRRTFAPERNQAVADEVSKLLVAGFVREVDYPEWLANVVLVKKSNNKWRMCVDFTDLNKACPKDSFPLPRIDLLVDSTSGHQLLSFMDAFSGYNQIQMVEEDQEKTSFITDRGLYCYKVMPFGLKNAGATYQRLVNRMFEKQMGRNVEVYIDDVLVKSVEARDHVSDLKETFDTIRRYRMRLNLAKCAFGPKAFVWDSKCEEAFGNLKEYLMNPPLLSRLVEGDVLYMYLAVSPSAVSSALVREEKGVQKSVYFMSRALRGAEERYPRIEKLAFALIVSARKLRPYFQAHAIRVLTEYPLKKVLQKPDLSGRLVNWAVELGQFDIEFHPRTAIKGQALADFFLEFCNTPEPEDPCQRSGVGVILESPQKQKFQYAIKLDFATTNNEVEYEAVLAGLAIAREVGALDVKIRSDSQVVVGQISGEFATQGGRLAKYLEKVHDLQSSFRTMTVTKIPRERNVQADALARAGSATDQEIAKMKR
ncbi:uncharacterized protein LOC133878998 [Alnus glutinosa]|uniref:uncharacterized protein LOC133878998 n=1 Tax=Alnus glutinosa TaxID=3517 RepID=UPI002D7895DF|nr:uncharacterized protein LOC133878998 [Alnus glutinosa]